MMLFQLQRGDKFRLLHGEGQELPPTHELAGTLVFIKLDGAYAQTRHTDTAKHANLCRKYDEGSSFFVVAAGSNVIKEEG